VKKNWFEFSGFAYLLTNQSVKIIIIIADYNCAKVVELADSLDSGSSVRKDVRVQVPPFAPRLSGFPESLIFNLK
jgi:hypothetical protein